MSHKSLLVWVWLVNLGGAGWLRRGASCKLCMLAKLGTINAPGGSIASLARLPFF